MSLMISYLIVGSGQATHNLSAMFGRDNDSKHQKSTHSFVRWMKDTMQISDTPTRRKALVDWETSVPDARFVHPREEHLMPLLVAVGAANNGWRESKLIMDASVMHGAMSLASFACYCDEKDSQ